MFGLVGLSGVVVNLAVLAALLARQVGFVEAQTAAILTAMTSNYFLNNAFTYPGPASARMAVLDRPHFFVQFGSCRGRRRLDSSLPGRFVVVARRYRERSNGSTVELCRDLGHHLVRTVKFAARR